jgi:hypothetical protein
MSFLDRSPGGFVIAANAFVYATVLVETWMLTTGSLVAMGFMMALIIVLSGVLCRFAMGLMAADDEPVPAKTATPERRRAAAPSLVPAAAR